MIFFKLYMIFFKFIVIRDLFQVSVLRGKKIMIQEMVGVLVSPLEGAPPPPPFLYGPELVIILKKSTKNLLLKKIRLKD